MGNRCLKRQIRSTENPYSADQNDQELLPAACGNGRFHLNPVFNRKSRRIRTHKCRRTPATLPLSSLENRQYPKLQKGESSTLKVYYSIFILRKGLLFFLSRVWTCLDSILVQMIAMKIALTNVLLSRNIDEWRIFTNLEVLFSVILL